MSSQVGARGRASVPTPIALPCGGTAPSGMSVPVSLHGRTPTERWCGSAAGSTPRSTPSRPLLELGCASCPIRVGRAFGALPIPAWSTSVERTEACPRQAEGNPWSRRGERAPQVGNADHKLFATSPTQGQIT